MENSFHTQRMRLLMNQKPSVLFALIAGQLVYTYSSIGIVENSWLIIWFLLSFSLVIVRLITLRIIRNKMDAGHLPAKTVEHIIVFIVFLSGVSWGVTGSFFIPLEQTPRNELYHLFVIFLIGGLTLGASSAYTLSKRAVSAFLFPALLPGIIHLIWYPGPFHYAAALMLSIFLIAMLSISRRVHRYAADSLVLNSKKEDVIQKLTSSQSKIAYTAKMTALGEMAGNIAHEINNPLMIIEGYATKLEKGLLANSLNLEASVNDCKIIGKTCQRISKITQALLTFSKDNENMEKQEISINELIDEVLSLGAEKFKSFGIDLHVSIPDPPPQFYGHPNQIKQALLNLLNNAFDATHKQDERWIHISVNETSENICIAVADSGPGISPKMREEIFLPFFSTKDEISGVGLGLAVTQGIMQLHSGRTYLNESAPTTELVLEFPKQV